MTYLTKPITIIGISDTITLNAIFDTGAQLNYLPCKLKNGKLADELIYNEFLGEIDIKLGNNSFVSGYRVIYDCIKILDNEIENPEFILLTDLNHEAIIGNNLMEKLRLILDMETYNITQKKN